MIIDYVLLSRIQFGFTLAFHIIFPSFSIGLALFLVIMEGAWLRTKNVLYLTICQFWSKVFAITFGLGVVGGVFLSYELGTNFGLFIKEAGGVIGSLFIFEVLGAFFLEAGFLGVMVFGWDKVGPKLHFTATFLVMVGTFLSAMGIMAANSWMQTPAGFHIIHGEFVVDNWFDVIFNPSYIPRLTHMLFAAYLTTSFMVTGISAWYLLKKRHISFAKKCFSFALASCLVLAISQLLIGDRVGLVVHEYQPIKTAAIEGVWHTESGAPFILFGLPNSKLEKNEYQIAIPKMASFINTHHFNGRIVGLTSVPPSDRPLVGITFWAFRVMLGIGILFIALGLLGLLLRLKKQLFQHLWFLRLMVIASPLGFISTITGWITAEVGRQPWIIYGYFRTREGASVIPLHQVVTSLVLMILIYVFLLSFYIYYILKLIRKGPHDDRPETPAEVIKEAPFKYLAPEGK